MARKSETAGLGETTRRRLSADFFDRLFGADVLRVPLGLRGTTPQHQKQRTQLAVAET
jgi:hypothetical protein